MNRKPHGKGPKWTGGHAALPRCFYSTPEYRSLSLGARALLVEFALKFMGSNNGNIEFTAEQAVACGIGCKQTFTKYKKELINAGWIVVTREGGLNHRPNLYALTYLAIDNTGKHYDEPFTPDSMPLHWWKAEKADFRQQRRATKRPSRIEAWKNEAAHA